MEMAHELKLGLTGVSYHFRILSDLGVARLTRTRQVRGSTQHFYVSRVAKNSLVAAILKETEKVDGFPGPARKAKAELG